MKKESVARTFGEFALIVVGVLAALAAEGWTGDAAERRLGTGYVEDLSVDVGSDSVEIERWRGLANARIGALTSLLEGLNSEHRQDPADVMFTLWIAQLIPNPRFSLVTSDDLVSTGNIRLLSSPTRRALLTYLARIETLRSAQTLWRFEKPAFAGSIPGSYFGHRCSGSEDSRRCLRDEAADQLSTMSGADIDALLEWRTLPDIRSEIQTGIAETHNFLKNLEDVARARDQLAAALVVRGSP